MRDADRHKDHSMNLDNVSSLDEAPTEIPTDTHPAEVLDLVIEALHKRYPGRIWRTRGEVRWLEGGVLRPLPKEEFRALVPRAIVMTAARSGGIVRTRLPRAVQDDVYHDRHLAEELAGVRSCPWVQPDGELCTEAGFHGRWYLHWEGEPAHPDDMGDEEMWDVLGRLLDLPFRGEADRVAYLGALLRCVVPMVGAPSPLTVITATTERSAKTYAAKLLGAVLLGEEPSSLLPPGSPTEMEYTLGAVLREEPALVWIDNLGTGETIDSPVLQAILTAPSQVRTRTVRSSVTAGGDPTRSIFLLTGNQIGLDREQARRTVVVNMKRRPVADYRTPDLIGWVIDNRRLVVSALLRLVVEWHRRGCQRPPRVLGSFERWSLAIGGPLGAMLPPELSRLWLDPDSRPLPVDESEWVWLFENMWPRKEGEGLTPLKASEVMALVDEAELPVLGALTGPGKARSRSTRFGGALKSLAQRDVPMARGWRIRRVRGRSGPLYLGLQDLHDLADRGYASKEGVDPGSAGPRGPAGGGTPPLQPDLSGGGLRSWRSPWSCGGSLNPENQCITSEAEVLRGPASQVGTLSRPEGQIIDPPWNDAIVAMARRGVRVDLDLWTTRYREAVEELRGCKDEESLGRLRSLRSYGPAVIALVMASADGRLRCKWRLEGTGRIRAYNPPVQGITKARGLREAICPDPGHKYLTADWHSAHVWIAAGGSGDGGLREALEAGELYQTAAGIWAPELPTAVARSAAKICVLASLNGAGATKLAAKLRQFGVEGITPNRAVTRRERWLEAYPDLRGWLRSREGVRSWSTPLGHRVELPEQVPDYASVGWQLQSIEADALRIVLRDMETAGVPVVLINQDEVLAEVPEGDLEAAMSEMQTIMDQALYQVSGLEWSRRKHGTCKVEIRDSWGSK